MSKVKAEREDLGDVSIETMQEKTVKVDFHFCIDLMVAYERETS